MRAIGGLLAGILAGLIVQSLLAYLTNLLFPGVAASAEGAGLIHDRRAAAAVIAMIIYFGAALVASWVGRAVGRRGWPGWGAGIAIAILGLVSAVVYPERFWAQFGAFLAGLLGTLFGSHAPLPRPRRAADG